MRHRCDRNGPACAEHVRFAAVRFQVTDLLGHCGENRTMVQLTNDTDQLSGVRVLVVQDDALLAMDLEAMLAEAGAVIVGLCRTLDAAIARADADDFAVAVLDFGLGSETASPVARRLANRGVPFILCTGKSRHEPSTAEWRACPIVERLASSRALVSAIRTVLSR